VHTSRQELPRRSDTTSTGRTNDKDDIQAASHDHVDDVCVSIYLRQRCNDEELVVVQNTWCAGQAETEAFISGDKQTSNINPCEETRSCTYMFGGKVYTYKNYDSCYVHGYVSKMAGWRYYYQGDQLIKVEDLCIACTWFRWQVQEIIFLFLFLPRKEHARGHVRDVDQLSLKDIGWGPPTAKVKTVHQLERVQVGLGNIDIRTVFLFKKEIACVRKEESIKFVFQVGLASPATTNSHATLIEKQVIFL